MVKITLTSETGEAEPWIVIDRRNGQLLYSSWGYLHTFHRILKALDHRIENGQLKIKADNPKKRNHHSHSINQNHQKGKIAMTTSKIKNLRHWVMKTNTNEHHNRIISDLFNALFVVQQEGRVIDYTPNIADIMTLDICQVQRLMIQRREGDYSQTDIIEALRNLEHPKLIDSPAIQQCHSKRLFDAIRLVYNKAMVNTDSNPKDNIVWVGSMPFPGGKGGHAPLSLVGGRKMPNHVHTGIKSGSNDNETDTCTQALEHWQQLLKCHPVQLASINQSKADAKPDQSDAENWQREAKKWNSKAFELQEQLECERAMNDSLRNVIIEMAETLHVADPDARINMTSGDLLDLITQQHDSTDCPF